MHGERGNFSDLVHYRGAAVMRSNVRGEQQQHLEDLRDPHRDTYVPLTSGPFRERALFSP